jgi:hypothetical protein
MSSAREKTISKLQEQARMITQLQNTMVEQQNIVLELVKGTSTESQVLATPMPSELVGSHFHILRNVDSQSQWNATGLPATSDLNIATNSSFGASSNSDSVLVIASGDASSYNLELNGYKNAWDPMEESDSPGACFFFKITKIDSKVKEGKFRTIIKYLSCFFVFLPTQYFGKYQKLVLSRLKKFWWNVIG